MRVRSKAILLTAFLCFVVSPIFSQTSSYLSSGPTAGQGPLLNTEGTATSTGWVMFHDDIAGGTENTWSSVQDIGFPFDFYGVAVDSFCVSKNFLFTFSTSVSGDTLPTTINDNSALPNATLPDSTIAYFWADYANGSVSLGGNDEVWRKTFGTAPNRQLWIKNFSYETEGNSFTYNFLVLEESSNNIYVVDARNGSAGVATRTVGVQLNSTTSVEHASSPNIASINGNTTTPWPNVDYFEFNPVLLVPNDVAATGVSSNPACGLGVDTVVVTATNFGTSTQTAISVQYSLNGAAFTSAGTITGSFTQGASGTIDVPVTLVAGSNDLVVVATISGDANTSNDTISTTLVKGTEYIYVDITTSGFPAEVYWSVTDSATGTVIKEVTPGTYSGGGFIDSVCVSPGGHYFFNAQDDYGDGWNGGTYEVRGCGGVLLLANNGGNTPDNGNNGLGTAQIEVAEGFIVPSICPVDNPGTVGIVGATNFCDTGSLDVAFEITNAGINDLTNVPYLVSIDGGAFTSAGTFPGTQLAGETDTLAFSVNIGSFGPHEITLTSNFTGDTDNSNDTVSGFIYVGDFEVIVAINLAGSFSEEIFWQLYDSNGVLVSQRLEGDYNGLSGIVNDTLCLIEGANYDFQAWDAYGDGWNGNLYQILSCGGNVLLAENGGATPNNGIGLVNTYDLEASETFTTSPCPLNDAGVIVLASPTSPATAGSNTFQAQIKNYGLNTLTSAMVNWTLNGVAQTPFAFSGSIATGDTSAVLNIGTGNVNLGSTEIVLWTTNPNGTVDDYTPNDTLVAPVQACSTLAGTYTMGGSGADLADYQSLLYVLQNCGISAATIINVNTGSGPYAGQVIFENLIGLSATNTLTINGAGEFIEFDPGFADERIVGFDGAKHITLDNVGIRSTGTTYGYGIHFINESDSNTIQNCVIDLNTITSTSSASNGGIVASGSISSPSTDGNNANYVNIIGNEIIGGASGPYYGIYWNGTSTAKAMGIVIEDNVIHDWYSRGLYLDEVEGFVFRGNDVACPNRANNTTRYGVYLSGAASEDNLFEGNYFHDFHSSPSTSTSYACYISSTDADTATPNVFVNNIVANLNTNGDQYAFYNSSSDGANYIHNTVSLENNLTTSTAYETYGFYQTTTASDINVINNIFYNNRPGTGENYCLFFNSTASDINSESNVFYVDTLGSVNYVGRYSGTNYQTLADWQTANTNAYDQGSIFTDPLFVNPALGDYTPNQPLIDNAGQNEGVTEDFFGASRGVSPDPGAIEFSVATTDLTVTEILSPVQPMGCNFGTAEQVTIVVKNLGTTTVTSATLAYEVNGGTPITESFSGPLAFNDTAHVTFSTTVNLSGNFSHDIAASSTITGDIDTSNDTADVSLSISVQTLPFFEDFESLSPGFSSSYSNGWETFNSDGSLTNPRWEAENSTGANENSSLTGPFFDHTTEGISGGMYMFVEASSPAALGDTSWLQSTCIDLGSAANPYLSYWYHMFGQSMGDLYVELDTNDGDWIVVDSIIGQQQLAGGDDWEERSIPLCNITGVVKLRFTSVRGSNFYSDMSIDDVRIWDVPPYNDAGIADFEDEHEYTSVPLAQAVGMDYSYSASIANFGTATNSNVTAFLLNAGGAPANQIVSIGTMQSCSEDTIVDFATPVVPTMTGLFEATVLVSITENDTIVTNDTVSSSFLVSDSIYARDNDNRINGIGANTGVIQLGQMYEITNEDTLTRIRLNLDGNSGDSVRVNVYTVSGGLPDTLVLQTDPIILSGLVEWYDIDFCDLVIADTGTYFVAAEQMTPNSNMGLGYTDETWTPNTIFYGDTSAWGTIESIGFFNAMMIRLEFGSLKELDLSFSDSVVCAGDTAFLEINNQYPNIMWSTGDTISEIDAATSGVYGVTVSNNYNSCVYTDSVDILVASNPVPAVTSTTNVDCNGASTGAADVSISNGTSPFTYLWSDASTNEDLSNAAVGTYTMTVTDVYGCTGSTSASLTEPTVLVSAIDSINNVSCGGNDGATRVASSGGTPGYTYLWSSGGTAALETSLFAGTYVVTVTDANGCTDTTSATISQPSSLTAIIDNTQDVSCFGGNDGLASSAVTGGTTPYTYAWSNSSSASSVSALVAGTYNLTVTDALGCIQSISATITEPTVLLIDNFTMVEPDCNGDATGSLSVSSSGGTTPYGYAWSNSATNALNDQIMAGTYTVTVTDALGCTASGSDAVTEPTLMVASIDSSSNVSCFGGNDGFASVVAGGGTPGYAYAWSTGSTATSITALSASGYTVTVTDNNGCTDVANTAITEPVDVTFFNSVVDVNCFGEANGEVDVNLAGGTTPYTYAWSNSATTQDLTGLTMGTYTVTVTDDNGCTYTSAETVSEPTLLLVSLNSATDVLCSGDATGDISVSGAGGTAPLAYTWSNAGSGSALVALTAGVYTVTVSDANGCTDTLSNTITENAPLVSTSSQMDETCDGNMDGSASVSLSGGVSPYSYMWDDAAAQTSATASNLAPGVYNVTMTDDVGCTMTGTATIGSLFSLPNPGITGDVTVCGGESTTLDAGTYTGYSWSTGDSTQTISVSTTGNYGVLVTDSNGCQNTDSLAVTVFDPLTLTLNSTDVGCEGAGDGSIEAAVGGGVAPFNYTWNDPAAQTTATASNLDEGSYAVDVVDAEGCDIQGSDSIGFMFTNPVVDLGPDTNGPVSITLDAGVQTGYLWNLGQMTQTIDATATGQYSVIVTNDDGCTASDTVFIEIWAVGISDPGAVSIMKVYPNPSDGVINLEFDKAVNQDLEVRVMNMNGEIVRLQTILSNGATMVRQIDLSSEAQGVYMIEVNSGDFHALERITVH